MANKKLEELSKTFTYGGGNSTAPAAIPQTNNQNPLAKLAETFSYDTKVEIPKTQPKAVPSLKEPSFDYDAVIKEYESLPNTNIFNRLWRTQKGWDAYNRKQELNPLYEQAKDYKTKQLLTSLGLSDEDIMRQSGSTASENARLKALLKEKGVTDKDTINAVKAYSERKLNEKADKNLTEYADEHPVTGTVLSGLTKVASDIPGFLQNRMDYVAGNALSNSRGANAMTRTTQRMREAASDELGGFGKAAYSVGTSIMDMLPIIALGGNAGLGYAGISAAQGSTPDLIDRGLNPNQIIGTSMANGAFEAILEKIPLGNLEKWAKEPIEKTFRSIAKSVGSQYISEGIEEGGTDIADTIYDMLMNGDKAELRQDINQKGFWPAMLDYIKQVGYDTLLGGISGGIMGAGNAGIDILRSNAQNNNTSLPALEQQTNTTEETVPTVQQNTPVEKPTSVDLPALETRQTNTPIEELKPVQEPKAYDTENVSDKSLNRILNDHFKMFASNEEGTAIKDQLKQAINEYEDTLSNDALNRINTLVQRSEEIMKNGNYEWKRDSGKRSGKVRHTTYPNYRGTVTDNVMTYIENAKVKNELVNKANPAYRTEIKEMSDTLTKANADISAWDSLAEVKESFDSYMETGDEIYLDTAITAVGEMAKAADINYSQVQKPFENGLNNALTAKEKKPLPSLNKVMKEDVGINGRDTEEEFSSKITYPLNGGVPMLQEGNTKTRQTARNSLAKLFSQKDESFKQHIKDVEDRKYQYEIQPMQKTEQAARDRIMKYGPDNVYDDIIKNGVNSLNDFATAVNLQLWYDSQGDTVKKHILGQKIAAGLTPAAQMLQYCNVYGDSALGMEQATDALAGSQIKEFKNKAKKHKNGKEAKQLSEAEDTAKKLTEEIKKDNSQSAKLTKALTLIGNDMTVENKEKAPKTFEKILTEVNNTLDRESASVEFSDTAKTFIATMIQENISTETMADEIKHYLDHGEFYTLDESIKLPEPTLARLNSILSQMGNTGTKKESTPLTYEEIRERVKNTLNKEMAKVDFTEEEISYLARMFEYGASNEDIGNALVRKVATTHMAIPEDALAQINDLYKRVDRASTSKERAELKEQAAAIAAEYSGASTFMDKWNQWRYLAMLGNPRTLIRNRLGNFTFRQVTNFKDFVAAGLETVAQKAGIEFERTKSMTVNPITDSELFKACREDFDNVAYEEATRGGSKYNMKSAVEGKRKVFKTKGIEWLRDKVSNRLESDDIKALKAKYTQALAGYLKANGYKADVLNTDNAILDRARAYAIQQAKIATFHEDSKAANLLNDLERRARESGGLLGKTAEVLMESTMPFKKTPINILKQGVSYSPASLLSAVYHIATKADANVWIDDLSKALTGSTILMMGYLLGKNGLLVGQRKDEDDPFNKGSNYALTIGDKAITIDWLAPAALPLFVGCELANSVSDESDSEGLALLETVASISEPVVEMSMMQGLENALSSLSNIKNFKGATFLENIGAGYASQVVPTLAGQLARTIDPLRRTTRTDDSFSDKPLEATLEKAKQKVVNKLPGLSMTNQPYLNAWGETEKNASGVFGGNVLGRALQNFVLPGYVNDTSLSSREKGLAKLEETYNKNGFKGSLIPSLADNNKPNGTRLSNEDYTRWARTRGDELKKAVDAGLMYRGKIDTKDLQDYMKDLELLANAIAKYRQFGTEIPKTYKKKYEAYINGGKSYRAVMEYLIKSSK